MLLRKKSAKSLGAAPTCKLSMANPSANYIGPFSTNSLISMGISNTNNKMTGLKSWLSFESGQ
jgi:hypothetical protein